MSELLSCKFNIDTACVELRYADGEVLSIYTPGIEGSFDTTIAMRAEMDWLIYNAPLEYAQIVLVVSRVFRKLVCRLCGE